MNGDEVAAFLAGVVVMWLFVASLVWAADRRPRRRRTCQLCDAPIRVTNPTSEQLEASIDGKAVTLCVDCAHTAMTIVGSRIA